MADRKVIVRRANGRRNIIKGYPKTASTAMDKNSLTEMVSGVMNPADSQDITVAAILLEEITAADTDYASGTAKKSFQLLFSDTEVEIDTTAALTVGLSYGLSNAYTVDQSNTTQKVFTCTRVISSTRALGVFKTWFGGSNNL